MMGIPAIQQPKENFFSKYVTPAVRPVVVFGLSFTYIYSIFKGMILPSLFEEILLAFGLALFGGRSVEKIKHNKF